MEEMMMVLNTTSQENPTKCASMQSQSIINSIFPTWKLYENPFYIAQQPQDDHVQPNMKKIHKFEILDLVSELEYERKERKKLESVNKKLARELSEERKNREAYESLCVKLAEEISANKSEIARLKKEIEEERKMLRVAEVLREERVQMKLSEAKHFLEEKMTKLHETSTSKNQENISKNENEEKITTPFKGRVDCSSGEMRRSSLTEKSTLSNESSASVKCKETKRRLSSEADNPHIRRGIKGFVEFPKVIRAMGSKSLRHSGNKLECQKAQIRMILKQRSPLKYNNTIITS
ncbi:hypothetical protein LIER_09842 [Lithospermum erythrorhizon]|uniref:Protein BRANCHLESS TRICHOME n=1 Tax=Lithospermum erythrorhizon TaxID=34254 RepID=A0AAV3PIF1_LITER